MGELKPPRIVLQEGEAHTPLASQPKSHIKSQALDNILLTNNQISRRLTLPAQREGLCSHPSSCFTAHKVVDDDIPVECQTLVILRYIEMECSKSVTGLKQSKLTLCAGIPRCGPMSASSTEWGCCRCYETGESTPATRCISNLELDLQLGFICRK